MKTKKLVKKSKLVRNDAQKNVKPVSAVQRFTINLLPKQVRLETLEGRNYTVVPMVMLREGVFAGSNGPLYYPEEELSKTPSAWDHKPIVVYHPERNGEGISACLPEVIETQKVGIMLNTKWVESGSKLTSEAWIENERADKVDERVLEAVQAAEVMEVSTGVHIDAEMEKGEFNDRKYKGIARNLRPDHLALLPDQIGACSVQDGAGLLRNSAWKGQAGNLVDSLAKALKKKGLVKNELSREDIHDIYSNFFVYNNEGKLFRLDYTASEKGVSLGSEDPKEIVLEYRTVAAAVTSNRDQSKERQRTMKLTKEQRKKSIDSLIANKESGWSEADRPVLDALKDEALEKQVKAFQKKEAITNKEEDEDEEEDEDLIINEDSDDSDSDEDETSKNKVIGNKKKPTTNQDKEKPKKFNYKEWMDQAPPAVQDFVNNGVKNSNEEKAKLIEEIVAHNVFSEADLKHRPMGELKNLAALARKAAAAESDSEDGIPNYSGMGPTVTGNTGEIKVTPLELPSMNSLFEPEKSEKK